MRYVWIEIVQHQNKRKKKKKKSFQHLAGGWGKNIVVREKNQVAILSDKIRSIRKAYEKWKIDFGCACLLVFFFFLCDTHPHQDIKIKGDGKFNLSLCLLRWMWFGDKVEIRGRFFAMAPNFESQLKSKPISSCVN